VTSNNDLTPQQWTRLLALLSLDGVVPLYEYMGLTMENKACVLQILRDTILEGRSLYKVNPTYFPPLADMLLQNLEQELGTEVSKLFNSWFKTVFLGDHAEQPEWSAWDIIFSHWAYSRTEDIQFLSDEVRNYLTIEYGQKVDTEDLQLLIQQIKSQRLSDWDMAMFERHSYSIFDESDPYLTVEYIVKIYRLQQFIKELTLKLSSIEKEQIVQTAQKLINELDVWMPGPIPDFDTLIGGYNAHYPSKAV
jgi:hypothetical protein